MNDMMLEYFPHKDRCPQDGRSCIGKICKYWVREKLCWYIEFEIVVKKNLNCEHYKLNCENWRRFFLTADLSLGDREDFSKPPKIFINIGVDSGRLANHLKKKFNLTDWKIEGRNYEGGDDQDLVYITTATYDEQDKIILLLEEVKQLIQKIILEEKIINTCDLCKVSCESLTDYPGHAICFSCEQKIILENLPDYFNK